MSDEDWVATTQAALGAIIKAPKLPEKLLKKPPFRFLHDIVTNFIKATGLMAGLYTADELDSGKVTEKEAKVQFLQKLVSCVQYAHNVELAARPTKIITGGEAELTNEVLLKLAELTKLPEAAVAAAVKQTLGGGASTPVAEAPPAAIPAPVEEKPAPAAAKPKPSRGATESAVPAVAPVKQEPVQEARPGTASARKPPPSVKTNEQVAERGEVAPAPAPSGVIVEEKKGADDEEKGGDDDWMKLVDQHEAASQQAAGNEEQAKGYLATEALKAKKEQEAAEAKAKEDAAASGQKTEGIVLRTSAKKGDSGAMGASELSKLREQLQLLTKASNPLGKLLEAIHEDVDTMARELEMWRTEARTQAAAAADAQRQTEAAMADVNAQLMALDDGINDQLTKHNVVRASMQSNDKTIDNLIRMVVNPDKKSNKR
jgi:TRAF3-interacting protein 1